MTTSSTGRRIKKSEGNKYGWIRDLKRGEVKFNKPVILWLPVDGTQDDNSANGMAKETEIALGRIGVEENDIQILSVQYPAKTLYENQFSMERRSFAQQHLDDSDEIQNPQYIKDIYSTILQPLIINSKGHRLSFNEAQTKFRNLTLFSHCHGSFVACKLMNYLTNEMKQYGYSEKEINLLSEEIISIGLSPRYGFHRHDGSTKFGFTMLDDSLASYTYTILTENAGTDCVVSTLTLGMEQKDNSYMFFSGDNLKYKNIDEDTFFTLDSNFMHSVDCYTNDHYVYQDVETDELRSKNSEGINFSHLIIRTLQNAVSLSKQNIKRTADNIISNETPITFKQGIDILNVCYKNIKFEGNNKTFEQNLTDYIKWVKDKRFKKAENKLKAEGTNDNILVKISNKSNGK